MTKVLWEFYLTNCYWEWVELVVGRSGRLLYNAHLFGVVTTPLYTYDFNIDVIRAFCEIWYPSTNTLHTMVGELSVSLFGGLLIKGNFYEESIHFLKE